MKKTLIYVALAVVCMVSGISCSGNKAEKPEEKTEVEQVDEVKSTDFDMKRLKELVNRKSSEISSDDYDFLIDQLEILVEKTERMSPQEYEAYAKNLSSDDMGAIMVIGMGLEGAKKRGKLSAAQLSRYNSLRERGESNEKK